METISIVSVSRQAEDLLANDGNEKKERDGDSWRAGKAKDMKSKIDGSEFLYKGTTLPNKGICHVEKCSAMLSGKGRI